MVVYLGLGLCGSLIAHDLCDSLSVTCGILCP